MPLIQIFLTVATYFQTNTDLPYFAARAKGMDRVQVHAAAALRWSSTRQLLKAQIYQTPKMGWSLSKVKVGFQKSDGLSKRTLLKIPD